MGEGIIKYWSSVRNKIRQAKCERENMATKENKWSFGYMRTRNNLKINYILRRERGKSNGEG